MQIVWLLMCSAVAVGAWKKDGAQCQNLDQDGRGCDALDCNDMYMVVLQPAGVQCKCEWNQICSGDYPYTEAHQTFAYKDYGRCVLGACAPDTSTSPEQTKTERNSPSFSG